MKFEPDTEMERLLRRHARRKATAASTGSAASRETSDDEKAAASLAGGAHLDADEMNAYAEGALSETMRARYFSHLADCDECRHLVTKLTLAANVATASSVPATVAAAPARSWRDWLAALFSPAVLRYGVPAFALLLVMVVAFVALRERREANLVAQNEQAEQRNTSVQTAPVGQDEQAAQTTAGTTAATDEGRTLNENVNTTTLDRRQADATAEPSTVDKQAGKKEADVAQNMPPPQNEPKPATQQAPPGVNFGTQPRDREEDVTIAKAQPPVSNAPVAQPSEDADRRFEQEAKKSAEMAEKSKTARPAATANSGGVVSTGAGENRDATASRRAQKSGTRERAGRSSNRSDDYALSDEAVGPNSKDDGTTETRSAGGRRFKRQGGAWVDTAYSSSRSTINVARGSEQYRALVADEPGIRAIADQLGGTVILMWKNRAYRIY